MTKTSYKIDASTIKADHMRASRCIESEKLERKYRGLDTDIGPYANIRILSEYLREDRVFWSVHESDVIVRELSRECQYHLMPSRYRE